MDKPQPRKDGLRVGWRGRRAVMGVDVLEVPPQKWRKIKVGVGVGVGVVGRLCGFVVV